MWDVTQLIAPFNEKNLQFLLTHPVWDVTVLTQIQQRGIVFLLTHPVWDVTDSCENIGMQAVNFYSHIPCGM